MKRPIFDYIFQYDEANVSRDWIIALHVVVESCDLFFYIEYLLAVMNALKY